MSDSAQKELEENLKFFGEVTASVSHDMSNIITIMNETGGLLEDMIEFGDPSELNAENLAPFVLNIAKQVDRGRRMIRELNRFAHSVDVPKADFLFDDAVSNVTALARRLALLKQVELSFTPGAKNMGIHGNPFIFRRWLFTLLRQCWERLAPETSLQLTSRKAGDRVLLRIQFPEGQDMEKINHLVEENEAILETLRAEGRLESLESEQHSLILRWKHTTHV